MLKNLLVASSLALTVSLAGCQSAYYSAWEQVGVEKRDIMVDRVEDAKESQEEAQEQFSSALEEFSALVNFDGGDLEDVYNSLNDEYEDSKSAAEDVSNRINKVQSVAEALFDEWEEELDEYENTTLRRESESKLRQTRQRYEDMLRAMRNAEGKMDPVLQRLQDNVLYLKHNLNANAIGALQGELTTIRGDVDTLLAEMSKAISESDAFIASMR
ncbi:DUF2959 domain-containing protein [Salinimonas sp. HHU 13199]|uniref:DUF2959 domain-containing protein n=1 Tax=Salinimonas profundi TaxID=2729140 RepID=A0ABR8LLI7_9ALTE|nr:DUF2959 domain-containing protein [Salinimonas profundi]MBD3587057.1 DUF2959 domain-containing protein [Salinimonas profundi]